MGATDADGDSLSYALSIPLTSPSPDGATADFCTRFTPISQYQFPNDVNQKGTYRLNPRTGLLNWDVPTEQGQYVAAVLVSEWRNGSLISQTQHDVLITVVDRGGVPVTPPAYEPAQLALITAIADEDEDGLDLFVSPNPVVSEMVQVDFRNIRAEPVTFDLLDNRGRVHKTVFAAQPVKDHRQQFDLAGKPAGLYFIRAESGGRQVVKKILKQ